MLNAEHVTTYPGTHTRYPDHVGNIDDARDLATSYMEADTKRADLLRQRDDAIYRARTQDGLTYRNIAAHVGLDEATIRKIVREHEGA